MTQESKLFLPVNWVDGMNINKHHFIARDDSSSQSLMELARMVVTPFNYGFNMNYEIGEDFIWMNLDNDLQLFVKMRAVKAILPCGFQFHIVSEGDGQKEFHCDLPKLHSDGVFYAVLSVDPFTRQPHGEPSVEEMPVRKPFVLPKIDLSVVEETELGEKLLGHNHLVIGRLKVEGMNWTVDESFIPPSATIRANHKLREIHRKVEHDLCAIENSTVNIVQKVRLKKQDNILAKALSEITAKIVGFLGVNLSKFRLYGPYEAPASMVLTVMNMARLLKNSIDEWEGCGKDELMTYLAEWCNVNQGDLEDAMNQLIKHEYSHNVIDNSVMMVNTLLDLLTPMFHTLAGLDFIGKKIETDLFVNEEMVVEEDQVGTTERKKGRFGFFGN